MATADARRSFLPRLNLEEPGALAVPSTCLRPSQRRVVPSVARCAARHRDMRFVLVHGGFHGPWCWERTVDEMTTLGHEAVAIDLPGHGERSNETEPTTMEGRIEAITSVVEPGDVLVGHSGGGFDVTMAADAVPDRIGHVCYLAAGLPREGRAWPEAM